jgi:hypothetical protein
MKTISNKKIKELRNFVEDLLSEEEVEKIIKINKSNILDKIYCATQADASCAGPLLDENGDPIPGTVDPFCACCSGNPVCWVAREVYGFHNIKWMLFRFWLINDSPKWLLKLYVKNGERFSKFIKNKKYTKMIIRLLMDFAIYKYKVSICY